MKVEITTFKDSGKWYDYFETYVSDEIPCFEVDSIIQALESKHPQLKEFNYVFRIDDEKHWQWRLVINTK